MQHGDIVPGEGRALIIAKAAADAVRLEQGGERLLTVAQCGGASADLVERPRFVGRVAGTAGGLQR